MAAQKRRNKASSCSSLALFSSGPREHYEGAVSPFPTAPSSFLECCKEAGCFSRHVTVPPGVQAHRLCWDTWKVSLIPGAISSSCTPDAGWEGWRSLRTEKPEPSAMNMTVTGIARLQSDHTLLIERVMAASRGGQTWCKREKSSELTWRG